MNIDGFIEMNPVSVVVESSQPSVQLLRSYIATACYGTNIMSFSVEYYFNFELWKRKWEIGVAAQAVAANGQGEGRESSSVLCLSLLMKMQKNLSRMSLRAPLLESFQQTHFG